MVILSYQSELGGWYGGGASDTLCLPAIWAASTNQSHYLSSQKYYTFNIAWPKSMAPPDLKCSLNFASPLYQEVLYGHNKRNWYTTGEVAARLCANLRFQIMKQPQWPPAFPFFTQPWVLFKIHVCIKTDRVLHTPKIVVKPHLPLDVVCTKHWLLQLHILQGHKWEWKADHLILKKYIQNYSCWLEILTHICLLVVEDHPVSCQVESPLLASLELSPILISKNFLLLFNWEQAPAGAF